MTAAWTPTRVVRVARATPWFQRLGPRLATLGASTARAASRWMRWLWGRAAYALALLPALTDWVDTGHWPQHPRELATEVSIGLLILVGVALLYRRGDRFRTLAETDPLTGLGNRLRFRSDIEASVARAHDEGRPLALAFVDVDRFKAINDRFGHAAGDEALRVVADALARSVRQGIDGCYRIGGDEFAVLLVGSDGASILDTFGRSLTRVSPRMGIPITCSVGVVALREGETAGDLARRADELMYAAKRGDVALLDDARGVRGNVRSDLGFASGEESGARPRAGRATLNMEVAVRE